MSCIPHSRCMRSRFTFLLRRLKFSNKKARSFQSLSSARASQLVAITAAPGRGARLLHWWSLPTASPHQLI